MYGGLALAVYGEPRETRDADFAVAGATSADVLEALRVAGMSTALTFDGTRFGGVRISRIAILGAADATGMNVLRPRGARVPGLARRVLDRALVGTLRGQEIRVVAPFTSYVLLPKQGRARGPAPSDLDESIDAAGPRTTRGVVRLNGRAVGARLVRTAEPRCIASSALDAERAQRQLTRPRLE